MPENTDDDFVDGVWRPWPMNWSDALKKNQAFLDWYDRLWSETFNKADFHDARGKAPE